MNKPRKLRDIRPDLTDRLQETQTQKKLTQAKINKLQQQEAALKIILES